MNPELTLAGRGRRLLATLIDFLLVPALAILLMLVSGVLEDAEDWSAAGRPVVRILLLGLVSYLLLNGYLLWRRGQTVGKALTGIAIVAADNGDRLPLWKLLAIRAPFFPLLYALPVPWFNALPLLDQLFVFRRSRRCVHDLACGSSVVRLAAAATASPSAPP